MRKPRSIAIFRPEARPATITGAQARGAAAVGALAVGELEIERLRVRVDERNQP